MGNSKLNNYIEDMLNADAIDANRKNSIWKSVQKEIRNKKVIFNMRFAYYSLAILFAFIAGLSTAIITDSNTSTPNDTTIAEENIEIPNETIEPVNENTALDNANQDQEVSVTLAADIDELLESISRDVSTLNVERDFEEVDL